MKQAEEFRRDYGEADESFCQCVRDTLVQLERKEERSVRKVRWSAVIALTIILLTATAAVAGALNQWGMLDFLNRDGYWGGKERQTNDSAGNIVEVADSPVSVSDGVAVYTVTESAYDGVYTYLTVNAVPVDKQVLLIDEGISRDNSTLFLNKEGLGDVMTIGEYAAQQGMQVATVYVEGMRFLDMTLNEDGSSTFILVKCVYGTGDGHHPNTYVCAIPDDDQMTYKERDAYQNAQKVKLTYYVSFRNAGEKYVGTDETDFGGLFPQMCSVEVIRTEITNYAIIRWKEPFYIEDISYMFEVMSDGSKSHGAMGNTMDSDSLSKIISFGAHDIGDTLTVETTKIFYGEKELVHEEEGFVSWTRPGVAYETAQHTFTLEKVGE